MMKNKYILGKITKKTIPYSYETVCLSNLSSFLLLSLYVLSILKQSFHLPFKTNLCPFCSDSLNPVSLNLLPYNTFEDLLFYLKPNTYSKLNLFVCLT